MNTHTLFKAALEASWQASLVILLILLLRPLLGLRVPASWRSLLWTLVLLRLLVPAFLLPPSPASLQNIAVVDRPFEEAALALGSAGAREPAPIQLVRQGPDPDEAPAASGESATMASPQRTWWRAAAFVWLSGAGCLAMLIAAATFRLQRRVQREGTAAPEPIERIWRHCCARLSVSRPPRLRVTDCVKSPALVGLWRPALLIPEDTRYSEGDWEHVFTHELAHFRRRDHWTQMVQLLALCAHWFNPLVWIGFRYLRADRELAADEWALRHLEGARSVAYGATLLKVLAGQAGHASPLCAVGIMEDGGQMKQRLRHIVSFAPRRLAGSVAGIAIVLALASLVLGRPAADLSAYDGLAPAESLVVAARGADQKAVEQLLANGVDVNAVANIRGERTALAAAVAGHAEEIIRLLLVRGADVNLKAEKADAPIIVALKMGWMDTAEFLLSRGAACDAEALAAAKGDTATVQAYLASASPGYDKVKLLGEIAAAHGHRELFALLYDALRELPEQRDSFPFSRGTFVNAIAQGHRGVVEELLARDPNLKPSDSVNRLAAAALRKPGMREWLISKGVKVPEYNAGEQLIDAAEREDLPEIRRLLAAGVDVNYRGESEWMPLCKAAVWGCPRAVSLLLAHHADPNPSRYSYSTLELAKTPEIADLLVAAGAKVKPDDIGYSVSQGSVKMVQWFLDHGVDPLKVKATGGYNPTLLFDARNAEVAELLIARGVPVNSKNKSGSTALYQALQMQESPAALVAVLIKHGANPNERGGGGTTPLMIAPDGATIDVLVAAGADLDALNDRGYGVAAGGAHSSNPSRLQALARHGLTLDSVSGSAQLINAISLRSDLAGVKRLLAMGVDPNRGDTWEGRLSATPLSVALSGGKFEIANVLRAAGAKDVGLLSEAAARGDLAKMTALLAAGAEVDERSPNGMTPLQFAIYNGRIGAVRLLLDRGANVNRFDSMGNTPASNVSVLLSQIEHSHFTQLRDLDLPAAKKALDEIAAAVRARKPDLNFRNEAGETALICSAQIGSLFPLYGSPDEPVSTLNAQRADGMTALMLAIVSQPKNEPREGWGSVGIADATGAVTQRMSGRAHVVKTLLERGADLTLRNAAGQNALDLARENGNEEILALLHGAKR